MAVFTPTLDRSELAVLAADVRALVGSETVMTPPRRVWVGHRRVTQRYAVEVPCLLDRLREVVASDLPAPVAGPERRKVPGSATPPGWNADASQRLADIYVGISGWQARLAVGRVPYDTDWQKAVLRSLAARADQVDRTVALGLAGDIARWRVWAEAQVS